MAKDVLENLELRGHFAQAVPVIIMHPQMIETATD